jgi:mRNA interferase HigB
MRVFNKSTLRNFYEKHEDCEEQLLTWYKVTTKASWKSFNDVKKYFNSVDCIKESILVFNIKGNNYRLVVDFNFRMQWAFITFIGTHADYDKRKFK